MSIGHTQTRMEAGWQHSALAAALAVLARIIWDEARRVGTIPPEHEWEPPVIVHNLSDLREALYTLVHGIWSCLVEWTPDGPADAPHVEDILAEALRPYAERIAAMGWTRRDGLRPHGGRR